MEDGIMKKIFYIAASLLVLAACTRETDIEVPAVDMTITARTETSADTRTVVEGETHVYWEPGDEIAVFSGEKSGKFTTDITASLATAEFNGTLGDEAWTDGMDLWAVYPYSEDAVFDGETITTVLPSEQVARAGSFGKDMNLAIAHSTTSDLQFYNVGGGIRFSVSQDGITEVVIKGLNGETLAGKVKVGFQEGKPIIQEISEGKTAITITPPDGEAFKKNDWYYIVAIPGGLENGFTFSFRKASDPNLVMPSSMYPKSVAIKRGIYGILTHIDKGMGQTVPEEAISFQDPLVKSIVVEHFDTSGDGELSYHEAAIVLSFLVDKANTRVDDGMVSIFAGTGITSFDEMVHFTGLTRIDDGAFAGCTELTSVIIPENIEYIGDNAFNGCTGLESITLTSETPPTIGEDTFVNTGDCPIIVPEDAFESYAEAWSEYENRIVGGQPDNQIWYTSSDGQVVIPCSSGDPGDQPDPQDVFGVNIISNEYVDGKGIIVFDGDVTRIGDTAFGYCENLTSISLPSSVKRIESCAFVFCTGLTDIYLPDDITVIDNDAFNYCISLTNVILPKNLATIGDYAFNECLALDSITIPEKVTSIGRSAFFSCENLISIIIPANVKSIGEHAFNRCKGLTELIISEGVTSIGYGAFLYCNSLTNITIPKGITDFGEAVFSRCEKLSNVVLTEGIESIPSNTFLYCPNLKSITLPGSVTNIGWGAFGGCTSLTSFIIPSNVTSIGEEVFTGCTSLTDITVKPETPPVAGGIMFEDTNNCPIYVPAGSLEAYKTAQYWSDYADRIQAIPSSSVPIP